MVELEPDFLLPAEAVKAGGVAFDLEVGHFQGDRLAGLAVVGLEKRRHAALGNHVGDLEALVEQAARRPVHGRRLPRSWRPPDPALAGLLNIPHLDDLDGNIVADLPFLGQGNQPFAGFPGMIFHHRLEDFFVQDESVEAIRALQDDVPFEQGFGRNVDSGTSAHSRCCGSRWSGGGWSWRCARAATPVSLAAPCRNDRSSAA